jgi:hypothetical protein
MYSEHILLIRGSASVSGKFATGGNWTPVPTTPAANLSLVSKTPVENNENTIRLLTP